MMDQIIYETNENPQVIIERAHGNLHLRGWDRAEIRIDAALDDAVKFEGQPDRVHISADSGVVIRLPAGSDVKVQRVDGEVLIKNLEGEVALKTVMGQLLVKNAGSIQVDEVHGNLIVKQLEGRLKAGVVHSNAVLRDIEGSVTVEETSGNLDVRGEIYDLQASARGQANLNVEIQSGQTYRVNARGNINCRLAPGAGAQISLKSKAESIALAIPGRAETLQQAETSFTLGAGESQLTLEAGGRIDFRASDPDSEFDEENFDFNFEFGEDFSDLAEEITQQVSEQIESRMEVLNEQLSSMMENLGGLGDSGRRELEHKRRILERKHQEMERKLAHARRQAYRAARQAEHRSQRGGRRGRGAGAPVSEEERLLILKMLEEGKIGVAEADMLLAALEGDQPGGGLPPVPPMPPVPPVPPVGAMPPMEPREPKEPREPREPKEPKEPRRKKKD